MNNVVQNHTLHQVAGQQQSEQQLQTNEQQSHDSQQPEQNGQVEPVRTFTEAQLTRMVKCQTYGGEIIAAPWHLMMQSRMFANMWESLGLEATFDQDTDDASFIFPLNEITTVCFQQILNWMSEHHGKPDPVIREDPITNERIWFILTDWEKQFFDVDFEDIKEYFMAANFLDLRSLYYYCAQECARAIMDKEAEQIRKMLGLPDDLTEEQKQNIHADFAIPYEQNAAADDANNQQAGPSGIQERKSEPEGDGNVGSNS